MVFLLRATLHNPDPAHFWSCLAFCIPGILVFATSAIYHFLSDGSQISNKLEKILENLDHFSIYLFIAGTYTPFLMNAVSGRWRTILLISIWVIAITGILYTFLKPKLPKLLQHRFVYTTLFVLMGWTIVIRIGEIIHRLNALELFFLLAGAFSYTIGAVIYATKRPRLFEGIFGFHELWHVMVLFGFCFHYLLILSFYQTF